MTNKNVPYAVVMTDCIYIVAITGWLCWLGYCIWEAAQ